MEQTQKSRWSLGHFVAAGLLIAVIAKGAHYYVTRPRDPFSLPLAKRVWRQMTEKQLTQQRKVLSETLSAVSSKVVPLTVMSYNVLAHCYTIGDSAGFYKKQDLSLV